MSQQRPTTNEPSSSSSFIVEDAVSDSRKMLQQYLSLHPPPSRIADAALTALADAPVGDEDTRDFLVQVWPGLTFPIIDGFWDFISSAPPAKRPRLDYVEQIDHDNQDPASRVRALSQISEISEFVACGGLALLGRWIQSGDVATALAVFSFLEKMHMTVELLRDSKIGKALNEALKTFENPSVISKGNQLLTTWKSLVAPKKESPVIPIAAKSAPRKEPLHKEVHDPFEALASLAAEAPRILKKKKVQWVSDKELSSVILFDVDGSPLEISSGSAHAGSLSHSDMEIRRFNDARQRERLGQGRRTKQDTDADDEIEASINWNAAAQLAISEECMFYPKNLKSYEKQDLADIHAGRTEVFYPDIIPASPADPSMSSGFQAALAATSHIKTIEVVLRGVAADTVDLVEASSSSSVVEDPAKFADEFVKLDSQLQKAIMGNEQLLKYFRTHPSMLKDLNAEKVSRIVGEVLKKAQMQPQQVQQQPQQQQQQGVDKTGWGVASIVSSIRSQVRTNMQQRPPVNNRNPNLPPYPPRS